MDARDPQPVRYCISLIYEATVSFSESTGKKKTNGMCASRENYVIGDQDLGLVTQETSASSKTFDFDGFFLFSDLATALGK